MEARIGGRELDPEVCERILRAAGGNPLFVEEMAAMVQEADDGEVEVPPTLQALLASRLDQLDAPERSVLERGAIEGEVFHHSVVQALTPEEPRLTSQLTALVRKELIRPDRPLLSGEDAFRFRHLLMRDAAYEGLPKAERAELHEQFADWLEEHGAELVELDELLGYHLEQAYRYRRELGQLDAHAQALATRAGERLAIAGSRVLLRQDYYAGLNLLERAADLFPDERRDGPFEIELGYARFNTGGDPHAVISGLSEAERRAAAAGDRVDELGLRLDRAAYELIFDPTDRASQRLRELAQDALPVFEAAGVDWGLAVAWNAVLIAEIQQGRWAGVAAAAERAIEHARRADHHVLVSWGETQLVLGHFQGATPVAQCLRWLDAHPDFERRNVLPYRDRLLAMLGRFEEANQLLAESAERILGLGAPRPRMWLAFRRFEVAMLDGDASRAEAAAREGCEIMEAQGELGDFMWLYSYHAQALLALGRDDEADQWLRRGQTTPSEERIAQMVWRQARGGCSPAAESTRRANGSRARRSHSPRRRTC